jgi:hypothetical protein
MKVLAIVLLAAGVLALIYGGFSYPSRPTRPEWGSGGFWSPRRSR